MKEKRKSSFADILSGKGGFCIMYFHFTFSWLLKWPWLSLPSSPYWFSLLTWLWAWLPLQSVSTCPSPCRFAVSQSPDKPEGLGLEG